MMPTSWCIPFVLNTSMQNELFYKIALSLVPQIGPIIGKKLIAHFGSATNVFESPIVQFLRLRIPPKIAEAIKSAHILKRTEKEINYLARNNIQVLDYWSDSYPTLLKECPDSPLILYTKGTIDFERVISIVGTRKSSKYGRALCENLVGELAKYSPLIISGLAYGIDILCP